MGVSMEARVLRMLRELVREEVGVKQVGEEVGWEMKGVCEIKMKACVGHDLSGRSYGTRLQWEKV